MRYTIKEQVSLSAGRHGNFLTHDLLTAVQKRILAEFPSCTRSSNHRPGRQDCRHSPTIVKQRHNITLKYLLLFLMIESVCFDGVFCQGNHVGAMIHVCMVVIAR